MITREYISKLAAEKGFAAACFCLPTMADEAPDEVRCFVLLLKSYVPSEGLVDAFYVAKNESYREAQALMAELEQQGIKTWLLSNLKLKPIATQSAGLARGLNTINYHGDFGSKFCMELIGLDVIPEGESEETQKAQLSCAACQRCMKACPGGAITENGFVKEKCIRFYMMSGKPMPEHLRPYIGVKGGSYAIIGCDLCQRVCPGNKTMEDMRKPAGNDFTLEEMLDPTAEILEQFGALYGRNYAIRNRIIAQALLAAGNSGDIKYLPKILQLKESPSPLVREHALWAEEKMKNLQKIY